MENTTSNNPKGRVKGKPNFKTSEIKELLHQFIEYGLNDVIQNYDSLGTRDKVQFLGRVIGYVMPKPLAEVEPTEAPKKKEDIKIYFYDGNTKELIE